MLRNLLPKLKTLRDLYSLQKMKISRNLSTPGKLADKPLFLYGLYTCILAPAFYVYSGDVIGQYNVWKASTLRKWLEDAEAELEQLRRGKEKGLREAEEQAAMEKARDEALESGVSLTHEELSTKVLGKGKNSKYLRGLGVGPTPASLSFKSHLESQAHSEVLSIRSEMELLREEQQREREVYQREREERERERQEERDRFVRLESLVTKFLDTRGTP